MLKIKNTLYLTLITTCIILLQSCSQNNYIKTELYLGLSEGESDFPKEKWEEFKLNVLNSKLSGYTEIEGNGFWKNDEGETFLNKANIIIYLHKDTEEETAKIDSIIDLICIEFDQESVLKIDHEVVAKF